MKNDDASSKMDLSVLQEIRRRNRMRGTIRADIDTINGLIRQRRRSTHMRFLEKAAEKVGIDIQEIIEEGRRRNRVEQRLLNRGYEKIRQKAKELVQEELRYRKAVRQRYVELYQTGGKKPPADPELKFTTPVSGGDWTEEEMDPPGGMVGGSACHDPVFAERTYSDEMTVGFLPPDYELHHLYPRIYASTGEDDSRVYLTLRQNLTLRREPLEPGEGDFDVDHLSVNLHGVGYSERRDGEGCPILLDTCGMVDAHYVRLNVKIFQTISSGFLDATLLSTNLYQASSASCSEPIVIELGAETFPCGFRIFNPDNGGSEPWILVTLETSVSGCNENASAEIDFSRPEHEGLELGCVSLFGDYV